MERNVQTLKIKYMYSDTRDYGVSINELKRICHNICINAVGK